MNWLNFFSIVALIPFVVSFVFFWIFALMFTGKIDHPNLQEAQTLCFSIAIGLFSLSIIILAFTLSIT